MGTTDAESGTAGELTPEELQARLREKREDATRRRETAERVGSTSDRTGLTEVERTCERCGETFVAKALRGPGGKLFAAPTNCPSCVAEVEAQERAEREREERQRRARVRAAKEHQILERLEAAGVSPWEHGDSTFDTFDSSRSGTRPLDAAHELAQSVKQLEKYEPARGLYLFGPTGAGKTHLAAAVARDVLMADGFEAGDVVFDRSLRLINRIQDCYSTGASTEEILERRFHARLWILDDLGTEQPSDDVVRKLTDILQERGKRPTLVTSNHAPEELEGRHREFFRITSRFGPAYFRTVEVKGPDRRFQVAGGA